MKKRESMGSLAVVVGTPATLAMLFWTLLASGQITLGKIASWHTFDEYPAIILADTGSLKDSSATTKSG
jgi:hypothetical protein